MCNATPESLSGRHIAGALLILLLGTTQSLAGNKRDEVTGYICATPSCDVVLPPGIPCICTKDNPWENRLSKLKLTCRKKEKSGWVACPVRPKYGN